MWTEADLRLYFDMACNGAVFFDTTGKIPRKVFNDTGPIPYYAWLCLIKAQRSGDIFR